MPELVNKSERVIHVGGVMIIPGESGEVSDQAFDHPVVQAMIDQGVLEEPKQKPAPKPAPAPAPAKG